MEAGEDLLAAAVRAREEAGIALDDTRLATVVHVFCPDGSRVGFFFEVLAHTSALRNAVPHTTAGVVAYRKNLPYARCDWP